MGDLFIIPKGDLSVYYLGQIFGVVGTVIPYPNNPVLFLGGLFQTINTIALTVGAFILVYTTVVGLLATAHEGEFLGKKWNGLWVPIRTVLGVASLFPAASGYSAIQIVVMWIIVQGIGAADTLWTQAVNYTLKVGSPYSTIGVSSVTVGGTMQSLFQGLVCQATAAKGAKDSDMVKYYQNYSTNTFSNGMTSYSMGPSDSCGTLLLCDPIADCDGNLLNTPKCWGCKAQNGPDGVMSDIINNYFAPIVAQFVRADTEYVQFYDNHASPDDGSGWIRNYCNSLQPAASGDTCCNGDSPKPGVECVKGWSSDFDNTQKNTGNGIGREGMNLYEKWVMYPFLVKGPGYTQSIAQLPSPASNYDFIGLATSQYTNAITQYIADQVAGLPPPTTSGWQDQATQYGWMAAGSYYYNIAQASASNMQDSNPQFKVNAGDTPPGGEIAGYRNNYAGINYLINDLAGQSQSGNQAAPTPLSTTDPINQVLKRMKGDLLNNFMKSLQLGTNAKANPLTAMSDFGNSMLNGAQYTYLTLAVVAPVIAGALAAGNFVAVGTGYGNNPWVEAARTFLAIATPLIYATLGALFTFGALLGMYIPLIPYIVFTVTVLGWFIATIEAMVAAPLIALGILSPGGQHELLGRAEPALMIIFNVFLRPTLMVMGLMAAMLLANVMVRLINQMYLGVIGSVFGGDSGTLASLGPGQQYVAVASYVFLMFTIMNKVFTLIHLLPERVLTYIGGHAIQYGEGEATAGIKHGMEAAAGAAAMGAKGGVDAGISGGEKTGKATKKGRKNMGLSA